jgi:hypothetical protein
MNKTDEEERRTYFQHIISLRTLMQFHKAEEKIWEMRILYANNQTLDEFWLHFDESQHLLKNMPVKIPDWCWRSKIIDLNWHFPNKE